MGHPAADGATRGCMGERASARSWWERAWAYNRWARNQLPQSGSRARQLTCQARCALSALSTRDARGGRAGGRGANCARRMVQRTDAFWRVLRFCVFVFQNRIQLMSGCKNVCLAGGPSTFLFLGGKKRKNRCHILNPHSYNRRVFSLQRSLQKREKRHWAAPCIQGKAQSPPRPRPVRGAHVVT